MTFEKLGINKDIIKAISERDILSPTSIQEKVIPVVKAGNDVIALSKTGSGKTAAFGIPIIESIIPRDGIQSLIISPTRELAVQIAKDLESYSKYLKIGIVTVFGGVALGPQVDKIRKSEIVVGTPGRLLDHIQRGTLDISGITSLVLDEADKMAEMGFIEDITRIVSNTPDDKQTLLFGATTSNAINQLKRMMHDPVMIKADVKVDLLDQGYYDLKQHEKFSMLVHLLNNEKINRVIIFCSTRNMVEVVQKNLRKHKFPCDMIHGKLSQNKRLNVIENFNKGKPHILVASTVAARGLHINEVTHVINYDLPNDPQEYIHRVGRTARAGEKGIAITLLAPRDHGAFSMILRENRITVKKLPRANFEPVSFEASPNRGRGGGRSFGGDRGGSRGGGRGGSSGFGGGRSSGGRSYGSGGGFGGRDRSGSGRGGESYGGNRSEDRSSDRNSGGRSYGGHGGSRSGSNRSESRSFGGDRGGSRGGGRGGESYGGNRSEDRSSDRNSGGRSYGGHGGSRSGGNYGNNRSSGNNRSGDDRGRSDSGRSSGGNRSGVRGRSGNNQSRRSD